MLNAQALRHMEEKYVDRNIAEPEMEQQKRVFPGSF